MTLKFNNLSEATLYVSDLFMESNEKYAQYGADMLDIILEQDVDDKLALKYLLALVDFICGKDPFAVEVRAALYELYSRKNEVEAGEPNG